MVYLSRLNHPRHKRACLGHLEMLSDNLEESEMTNSAVAFLYRDVLLKEKEHCSEEEFYNVNFLLHYFHVHNSQLSEEIEQLMVKTVAANKKSCTTKVSWC